MCWFNYGLFWPTVDDYNLPFLDQLQQQNHEDQQLSSDQLMNQNRTDDAVECDIVAQLASNHDKGLGQVMTWSGQIRICLGLAL